MEQKISMATLVGILALSVVLAVPPVVAQVDPECTFAKLKQEGKAAAKVLKCHATAAKKHEAVDSDCVVKALTKLDEGFLKAEGDGPCYDGAAFRSLLVSEAESGITGALYPTGGLSSNAEFDCASAKLKAAAKLASKTANCHAKAVKKGASVDPTCLQKVVGKFDEAFQEAEAVGGCAANGDAGAVEAYVDQLTDGAVALLTADVVPIRCCAASAAIPFFGTVNGCADLVLGRCTTAALLLASAGGTATSGLPGNVCDGAMGACASARTGTSTCCQASKDGLQICAEGPSLAGRPLPNYMPACDEYGSPGGVTFTKYPGAVCKDDPSGVPHCEQ